MELPDPATLTDDQCTGAVYLRLSEATVAPVLFADPKYVNALNFNHMVVGNASEIPELLEACHALTSLDAAEESGVELERAVKNFREELGDQTWYTAGELRAAGACAGNPYAYAGVFDVVYAAQAPFLQGPDAVREAIGELAYLNGKMGDINKRALYYVSPETLHTVAEFPSEEQAGAIIAIASKRLRVLAGLAAYTGWSLREVMAANIRKLRGKGGRFAEKFEACRALHRDTKSEMEAHG